MVHDPHISHCLRLQSFNELSWRQTLSNDCIQDQRLDDITFLDQDMLWLRLSIDLTDHAEIS